MSYVMALMFTLVFTCFIMIMSDEFSNDIPEMSYHQYEDLMSEGE